MANDVKFTAANITRFQKGGIIAQEHDGAAKNMHILLQGSVGVYKDFKLNSEIQLRVLSQGSFFGEMSLFLGKEYDATYVALTDAITMVINRRNVADFFAMQSDMTFNVFEGICRRLDELSAAIEKSQKGNAVQSASHRSALFPEGHGTYLLPMNNVNECLYETKIACPLCGHNFTTIGVITSRLRQERTDPDMRVRYKDVEPLYYEITTCPNCFFSASTEAFPTVSKKLADAVNQKVGPYKLDMYIRTGMDRDTFTVFAGYYLAILCAAVCFDDYQMITAGFWQKLSRLYQDCGDSNLFSYATEQALNDYLYAYEHFRISDKQLPQLCYVIGDLYYRQGEIDKARNYYYLVKTNHTATVVLKRQAEIKMDEIKEMKKA